MCEPLRIEAKKGSDCIMLSYFLKNKYRKLENKSIRISRFISSFSRIETLVLDELFHDNVLEMTIGVLGEISIERLEVKDVKCGKKC